MKGRRLDKTHAASWSSKESLRAPRWWASLQRLRQFFPPWLVFVLALVSTIGAWHYSSIDPMAVLLVGLIVSLLLFGITLSAAYTQNRAIQLAREMTEELQYSREQYRAATDTAHDAILIVDNNSCIVSFNRAAEKLFGYAADEVLGMPFKKLLPADSLPRHSPSPSPCEMQGKRSGTKDGTMELPIQNKEGALIPTEMSVASWSSGNGRFCTAILRDARLRKQAEDAQRALNEALEKSVEERTAELKTALENLGQAHEFRDRVMESAVFGLVALDDDGRFRMVNQHFADMTGYSIEELVGQDYSILLSADNHAAMLPYFHRVMRKRQVLRDFETEIVRQDRSTMTIVLGWSPIVVEDKVVGVVGTALDISARKRAEEQVHVLNEELERRVKKRTAQLEEAVKELEAFSYSVSHDLRAPLRHINGHVQLLIEELRDMPEKARSRLQRIGISALQMGELIDDLLMFSHMGRAEMRHASVDMHALAKETMQALLLEIGDRRVEWEIENLPPAKGDLAMLKQVWVNLLSNALKYSGERNPARIDICGEITERGERCYWIKDNGAGFDMAYADKLFAVFQRLHPYERFEGTGIGLANVRRIVERHGGQVWAESTVERGATFYFTLPEEA